MSFTNSCRLLTRHVSTPSRLGRGGSLISPNRLAHRAVTCRLLQGAASARALPPRSLGKRYSSSTAGAQTAGPSELLLDPGNTTADIPSSVQSESSDPKRVTSVEIRQAEYDLYQLFSPQPFAAEEGSTRDQVTPSVLQVWRILAPLISANSAPAAATALLSAPSPGTHQLRKLSPYAPYVARLLEKCIHDNTSAEHAEENMELAQWCFLSSILFGTPPIPSKTPVDPAHPPPPTSTRSEPPVAVHENGIRDVPQSRWPSKSARNAPHVFSQSKLEQTDDIEQCLRPYFQIIRNTLMNQPNPEAEDGVRRAKALDDIEATLIALDIGVRALAVPTKIAGRGQSLHNVAVHERAVGPVVKLLGKWLESNLAHFRDAVDDVVGSVPVGIARSLRILQRMNMRDLAEKLQHRMFSKTPRRQHDSQSPQSDNAAISLFLGACLMRNEENWAYRLNKVTKSQDTRELLTLWEMCSPILRQQSDNEIRTHTLSAFLKAFVAHIANGSPEADKLKRTLAEIYALLPRPTPLPAYHSLLSLYAGISPSSAAGSQESGHTTVSSEASLANLTATWARMREEKVTPDIKAYMLLITGLGKKGDYQALQQIWEELTQDAECKALWQKEENSSATYPPMRVFNHFISILFNLPTVTGSATLALSLFNYLCDPKSPYKPDLFTMNIVLRHYARKKDVQAIMDLIEGLPRFQLSPDLVTYTTLITGLLDAGKPSAAKGILDVMQKANIVPNTYVYSLLIADLARKGSSEAMASAEALLQQMNKNGLKATATTWTSLASGYFRANMVKEGLDVIKRAQSKGIQLTRVSYNMVLRSILFTESVPVAELEHILRGQTRHAERSLGPTTNTEAALLLLRNMIDSHIEPDQDTWFIVLDSLARQEKWAEGEVVMRLMKSRRFVVKEGSVLTRVVQRIRDREQRRRW